MQSNDKHSRNTMRLVTTIIRFYFNYSRLFCTTTLLSRLVRWNNNIPMLKHVFISIEKPLGIKDLYFPNDDI